MGGASDRAIDEIRKRERAANALIDAAQEVAAIYTEACRGQDSAMGRLITASEAYDEAHRREIGDYQLAIRDGGFEG